MSARAFVVFGGAELPWIYPLGAELSAFGKTTLIRLGASPTLWRQPVYWPFDDAPAGFERQAWSYPPGFNGTLRPLFTGIVQRRFLRLRRRLASESGARPYVIVSEPRFARYVTGVEPDRLVYLCYDDYSTYDRLGNRSGQPFEQAFVERCGTVVCSSRYQRDSFRERFAHKRAAIHHLPHGSHAAFLNPAPADAVPSQTVCVTGSLTARYDWALIEAVIARLPDVEFVFAGEIVLGDVGSRRGDWQATMRRVLGCPNVRHVVGLRHRETAPIYWNASLNWMPYDERLAFVRAACPLKLADGLASGRPVVSSDVPESRSYPAWIAIYHGADEAVAVITERLRAATDGAAVQRRVAQVEFARRNSWASRARQLVSMLERRDEPGRLGVMGEEDR